MKDTPIIVELKLAPNGYDIVESGKTQRGDLLGNPVMWHIKDNQIRWIPVGTSIGDDVVKLFKDLSLLVARPTATIEDDKQDADILELVENLTLKEKVFINIIQKLTERGYDKLWISWFSKDNIKIQRLSSIYSNRLLFFTCLASNEVVKDEWCGESLFNTFDNYHAIRYGHTEEDITHFIHKHYDLLNKEFIMSTQFSIDQKQIALIKICLKYLDDFLLNFMKCTLDDFICGYEYKSWQVSYIEGLRNGKQKNKIDQSVLLNEGLYDIIT